MAFARGQRIASTIDKAGRRGPPEDVIGEDPRIGLLPDPRRGRDIHSGIAPPPPPVRSRAPAAAARRRARSSRHGHAHPRRRRASPTSPGSLTDELTRLEGQLNRILDQYASRELDTDDIPPTAQTIELENILRDDVRRPAGRGGPMNAPSATATLRRPRDLGGE
jgi:hypothetical protein